MKRVVFLYADTGGGHRSAAESISQAMKLNTGDKYNIKLVNGFRNSPFRVMEKTYPLCVNYARPLYKWWFEVTDNQKTVGSLLKAFEPLSTEVIETLVENNPADLYVSCHPMFNHSFPVVLQQMNNSARFINVVTDLVYGHAWHYTPKTEFCIVPTQEIRTQALSYEIPNDKIAITGQPVAPNFQSRMGNREQTLNELDLDPARKTILVMGGGDGMGKMKNIVRGIAQSDLRAQMIVICGRNKQLRNTIDNLDKNMPVRTLGFVNNVPELMGASDVLATKAGPGSICEGFIAGLPILLFDAIPGQEEPNVNYVTRNGAGAWCPTPKRAVAKLRTWFNDKDLLDKLKAASQNLARPSSSYEIADIAAQFV